MKEEKYIKDKLSAYESPMDMDAMWSTLEENLDKEKREDKAVVWFLRKGLMTSFFIIALFGFLLYTFSSSLLEKKNHSVKADDLKEKAILPESKAIEIKELNEVEIAETISHKKTQEQQRTLAKSLELNNQKATLAKSLEQIQEQLNSNTKSIFSSATTSKFESTNNQLKTELQTTENPNDVTNDESNDAAFLNSGADGPSMVNNRDNGTNSLGKKAKHLISNESTLSSKLEMGPMILKMNVLPLLKNYINWTRTKEIRHPAFLDKRKRRIELDDDHENIWRASINGGQTISLFSYFINSSERVALRILNERTQETNNTSFGLGIEHVTKKGLKFYTGLNYINHAHFYSNVDTLYGSSRETLVETVYLGDDGSELGKGESRIDTVTNVDIWNYKDYRSLHSFQMPLMVGYELHFSKFDLSFMVGPALNYMYTASRPLTYDDEQLAYAESRGLVLNNIDQEVNKTWENKFMLSAGLKFDLGYSFNEKTRAFASVEAGKLLGQLRGGFPNDHKTDISYFGLKTGISYAF